MPLNFIRRTIFTFFTFFSLVCALGLVLGVTAKAQTSTQTAAQIRAVEDFFTAVQRDNSSAILGFFLRDFDPNVQNAKGDVPLNAALKAQAYKALDALLAHPKIDVNFLSAAGESPLMLAVIRGEEAWAAKLMARDADVNKTGWTPLHYAASAPNMSASHVRLAKVLIDKYAYIDAEAPSGNTPLMMAAQFGTEEMVKLLLDEGADPTLTNNDGANAVNLALYAKRDALAESLHKAHAAWRAKAAAKDLTNSANAVNNAANNATNNAANSVVSKVVTPQSVAAPAAVAVPRLATPAVSTSLPAVVPAPVSVPSAAALNLASPPAPPVSMPASSRPNDSGNVPANNLSGTLTSLPLVRSIAFPTAVATSVQVTSATTPPIAPSTAPAVAPAVVPKVVPGTAPTPNPSARPVPSF